MNPTTERILRDLLRLGALVEDIDKSPTPAASVPLTNAVASHAAGWAAVIDAAIDQAARRLGVWPSGSADRPLDAWSAWHSAGNGWTIWKSGDIVRRSRTDAPTAALFLLLLGLPEVAVTCPDCQARSATGGKLARWEWKARKWVHRHDRDRCFDGFETRSFVAPIGHWTFASRPCPTCTVDGQPLGRVQREPARLLLDAIPRTAHSLDSKAQTMHTVIETTVPGDPAAREALTVLADQLQAHGDPRGTWVALWLAGPEAFAQVLGDVEAALDELAKCPGMAPGEYEGFDVHVRRARRRDDDGLQGLLSPLEPKGD